MAWVLPGSHVSAQEPLAHGLLGSVHPAAELMLAAMEVADRFRLLGARRGAIENGRPGVAILRF